VIDHAFRNIGFKIFNLDGVIGRRGFSIQFPPSILVKLIILKPIAKEHVKCRKPNKLTGVIICSN
jgi:hypothetical protein